MQTTRALSASRLRPTRNLCRTDAAVPATLAGIPIIRSVGEAHLLRRSASAPFSRFVVPLSRGRTTGSGRKGLDKPDYPTGHATTWAVKPLRTTSAPETRSGRGSQNGCSGISFIAVKILLRPTTKSL